MASSGGVVVEAAGRRQHGNVPQRLSTRAAHGNCGAQLRLQRLRWWPGVPESLQFFQPQVIDIARLVQDARLSQADTHLREETPEHRNGRRQVEVRVLAQGRELAGTVQEMKKRASQRRELQVRQPQDFVTRGLPRASVVDG